MKEDAGYHSTPPPYVWDWTDPDANVEDIEKQIDQCLDHDSSDEFGPKLWKAVRWRRMPKGTYMM